MTLSNFHSLSTKILKYYPLSSSRGFELDLTDLCLVEEAEEANEDRQESYCSVRLTGDGWSSTSCPEIDFNHRNISIFLPVGLYGLQRSEVAERDPVQEHGQESVGEAVGEDSGVVTAVHLYAGVAVVRRDDPVLGEHEVDGATRFPPLELDGYGGVGLRVPLSYLLEAVHDVAW